MTPSKPTSIGISSKDSATIGSFTDLTPMTNAETISNESEFNPLSGRKAGEIKHLFDKIGALQSINNLDFSDRLAISDIIWEAWYCGFNDRKI